MAKLIDANVIIRFLVKDNLTQAKAVKQLLLTSEDLLLSDLVLAEIVWVLQSVYKLTKEEIIEKLLELLRLKKLLANYSLLMNSLLIYKKYNVSFIDAYLTAYAEEKKLEGIYSFDKGLDKIKTIRRVEP